METNLSTACRPKVVYYCNGLKLQLMSLQVCKRQQISSGHLLAPCSITDYDGLAPTVRNVRVTSCSSAPWSGLCNSQLQKLFETSVGRDISAKPVATSITRCPSCSSHAVTIRSRRSPTSVPCCTVSPAVTDRVLRLIGFRWLAPERWCGDKVLCHLRQQLHVSRTQ